MWPNCIVIPTLAKSPGCLGQAHVDTQCQESSKQTQCSGATQNLYQTSHHVIWVSQPISQSSKLRLRGGNAATNGLHEVVHVFMGVYSKVIILQTFAEPKFTVLKESNPICAKHNGVRPEFKREERPH